LILPHMLGLCLFFTFDACFYCFFINKKKKNLEEKMQNFILFFLLIAFQILHVFFPDILVHFVLIEYA
jgi:hypothetical protein